jgi:alpha/beta superfamily hydrolase
MPSNDAWPRRLRELGADVEIERPAGYVEMMLDPHDASVPAAAVAAAVAFVARDSGPGSSAGATVESAAPSSTLVISPSGVSVRESAERLDDDALFGVLTTPVDPAPCSGEAIALLNAGAIHHVGPNRMYVALARSLAARGHVVLRFDLAGLGDSPPRGERENVVYPRGAHGDIARAVAFLARQDRVARVHLAGICSGAYHAFAAAVRGAKVASVVPINPLTFFWHDGTSVVLPAHQVAGEAQRYARAVFDPDKWKKLLRGEVDVAAFAEVLRRRGVEVAQRRLRDVARRVGRPLPDDLGAEIERAADNGVKLRFVFASDDPGFDLLRGGAGSSFEKLRRRGELTVDILEGPNHTFTQVWSQGVLLARLEAIFAGSR